VIAALSQLRYSLILSDAHFQKFHQSISRIGKRFSLGGCLISGASGYEPSHDCCVGKRVVRVGCVWMSEGGDGTDDLKAVKRIEIDFD
jgi:hypothetical protein